MNRNARLLPGLCAGLLMLVIAGCGRAPDQPGVLIEGHRLAVVDMHLHTGTWEAMTPQFQERVSERVPRVLRWIMPYVMPYTLEYKPYKAPDLPKIGACRASAGRPSLPFSPPAPERPTSLPQ